MCFVGPVATNFDETLRELDRRTQEVYIDFFNHCNCSKIEFIDPEPCDAIDSGRNCIHKGDSKNRIDYYDNDPYALKNHVKHENCEYIYDN